MYQCAVDRLIYESQKKMLKNKLKIVRKDGQMTTVKIWLQRKNLYYEFLSFEMNNDYYLASSILCV